MKTRKCARRSRSQMEIKAGIDGWNTEPFQHPGARLHYMYKYIVTTIISTVCPTKVRYKNRFCRRIRPVTDGKK